LVEHLNSIGVEVWRGPLDDVVSRYYEVVNEFQPRNFLRLTADSPLTMPDMLDEMIAFFEKQNIDYLSNTNPPTFPDGLDIEIVKTDAFLDLIQYELSDLEKEHVTLGFASRDTIYKRQNFRNDQDLSHLRWTVDYPDDLDYLRKIMSFYTGREATVSFQELLQLIESQADLADTRDGRFRNMALSQDSAKQGGLYE
jgi:spore coat polysaccharide biosynthesis protein SpsF (cytidylyltransferase family)